jgi:hypothetical protein
MHHQRLERRRRVELEAHRVQLVLGGHEVRAGSGAGTPSAPARASAPRRTRST